MNFLQRLFFLFVLACVLETFLLILMGSIPFLFLYALITHRRPSFPDHLAEWLDLTYKWMERKFKYDK